MDKTKTLDWLRIMERMYSEFVAQADIVQYPQNKAKLDALGTAIRAVEVLDPSDRVFDAEG
jgi:hypothetical protein